MTAVIQFTVNIINSGNFALSPEYFELFNDDNNSNPELIFALDQRGQLREEHSRWAYWSVSGNMIPRPEFPSADGTDGPTFTPEFFQSWVDAYGAVDPADADARFFQEYANVPDELRDLTGLSPLNDQDRYYCFVPVEFEMDRGVTWGPRKGEDVKFITCDGGVRIYPLKLRTGNSPTRDLGYIDHTLEIILVAFALS